MSGSAKPVDHADLLRRWDSMSKVEAWSIEHGDLHNMIDEAVDQIEMLRTALTDLLDAQFKWDRSLDRARGKAREALHVNDN